MRTDERKYICYSDDGAAGRENDKCVGWKIAVTLALCYAAPLQWMGDRALNVNRPILMLSINQLGMSRSDIQYRICPILAKFTESDIGEGKMYNPTRFY